MFERYTEKARRVIFFARYEASQFGSHYIESEHFLLGLLREDKTLANRFLHSHTAVDAIRRQVEARTTVREKVSTSVDLPFSHECKRILAYGAEEAERLRHKHIGTEHLLLGVLREEKGWGAALLHERGVELAAVRADLRGSTGEEGLPAPGGPEGQVPPPIRFERFTEAAMRAALLAVREANELGSAAIEMEHLLLGVLREDRLEATRFLRSEKALESIRREIGEGGPPNPEPTPGDDLVLSREYLRVLRFACEESERMGQQAVETGHLLLGLLQEGPVREILLERGLTASIVRNEMAGS